MAEFLFGLSAVNENELSPLERKQAIEEKQRKYYEEIKRKRYNVQMHLQTANKLEVKRAKTDNISAYNFYNQESSTLSSEDNLFTQGRECTEAKFDENVWDPRSEKYWKMSSAKDLMVEYSGLLKQRIRIRKSLSPTMAEENIYEGSFYKGSGDKWHESCKVCRNVVSLNNYSFIKNFTERPTAKKHTRFCICCDEKTLIEIRNRQKILKSKK